MKMWNFAKVLIPISALIVKRLAIMTPHRRPILTPHFGEAFAR
jgi:hypothetical protein